MKGLVTRIKRMLRVYRRLCIMSLETDMYNRSDFVVRLVFSLSNAFVYLMFVDTIFNRYGSISGWSRYEVILIYGIYTVVMGILNGVVMGNIVEISNYVYEGVLDKYITKPIRPLFLMSFQKLFIFNILDVIVGFVFIAIALTNLGITLSFGQIVFVLLLFIPTVITLYSLALILISTSFVTGRAGHIFYIYDNMTKVGNMPFDSHTGVYKMLFGLVFPFVLIASVPAGVLARGYSIEMIWPFYLVAVVWALIARYVWRKGMSKYTSANG